MTIPQLNEGFEFSQCVFRARGERRKRLSDPQTDKTMLSRKRGGLRYDTIRYEKK